jgi:hypothetical protein
LRKGKRLRERGSRRVKEKEDAKGKKGQKNT